MTLYLLTLMTMLTGAWLISRAGRNRRRSAWRIVRKLKLPL
jgi:hypothetical protein